MNIIKTASFRIATISKGNPESEKIAIMIPGRLDTKDYNNFTNHMELLADLGYIALAFDPAGTWDSPDKIAFTTTNLIKAVNELIEYFGNRQTLLLGHSRGGQTAMLVGATNPHVSSMILINASYGPPSAPNPNKIHDGYLLEFRDLPPGDKKTEVKKEFHLSLDYFRDGKLYDPLPKMKSCTKPKLLIASTDDEWTSPDEVKEVFDLISEPKVFHEIPGKHDYRRDKLAINNVSSLIGDFIKKYGL